MRGFHVGSRGKLVLVYLANSATFLASSEGTSDKDMNGSALDLYKSFRHRTQKLDVEQKASGRRICTVCYFWIHMEV